MVSLGQAGSGIEEVGGHFARLTLLGEVSTVGLLVRTCSDELSVRLAHVLSRSNDFWHNLLFPKAETCIRSVACFTVPRPTQRVGLGRSKGHRIKSAKPLAPRVANGIGGSSFDRSVKHNHNGSCNRI